MKEYMAVKPTWDDSGNKKRLLHAVIGGCITCWEKRNTELHGEKKLVSAHIRLQKLKLRVPKAYANDKHLVPFKLISLFSTPLLHQATTPRNTTPEMA